ncbi:MAG: PLP-dependent aminotransferase family protein [Ferrovibrio sp.]|uniref:aminotransferase-like domain-containing protein n=1 Tax=Ferrovibrio sp. TaxID=1917215 RepID=UPI00260F75EC|nr:PLP-dependent aminotransferase family protein [Ferrovibrio sp.]MCW0235967.1 PLP-dependent aminotransferase family protein [Ferrovibrio sp.]
MTESAFPGLSQAVSTLRASEIRELLKLISRPEIISFAGGIPDPALFPLDAIGASYQRVLADPALAGEAFQYSISEGYLPLRDWIVGYLRSHGIETGPEQVLITSGAQQALDFLGRALINPGDSVVMSSPSYLGAIQVFGTYQPTFLSVPMDNEGVVLEALEAAFKQKPKFFYLTPDFCNPAGITTSLARRQAILKLAHRYDVAILEDSPYEELRYENARIPSFAALELQDLAAPGSDGKRLVIYVGSLSKVLTPALRIGWVCADPALINKLVLIKQASDLHCSTINQMVACDIARSSHASQVAKLRKAYKERRDVMLETLERCLPKEVRYTKPDGGMFIWLEFPDSIDGTELLAEAVKDIQVAFVPGSAFYATDVKRNTARLSFSLGEPARIREGIERLSALLQNKLRANRAA